MMQVEVVELSWNSSAPRVLAISKSDGETAPSLKLIPLELTLQ